MNDWQVKGEINVPVALIRYVYQTRCISPGVLRTLLYLHMYRYDRQVVTAQTIEEIANGLKVTTKTVNAHIQQLIEVNFMGLHPRNKQLYVRSLKKILPTEQWQSRWYAKVSLPDLQNHFTEFILAATVSFLVRTGRRAARKSKRAALQSEGALQALSLRKPSYQVTAGFAISLSDIGRFLGRTISWVDKYKRKAASLGWITIQHDYVDTGFNFSSKLAFKRANPEVAGRVRQSDAGMLILVATDILTSDVNLKRGKKV